MSNEATRSARTGRSTRQRWTREEIEELWTLGPDELAMLAGKRGTTRLGFAIVLRFFARKGRFPDPAEEPDGEAVAYVARQVGVPVEEYEAYDPRGRAAEYHRAQIRDAFGFRPATVENAENLSDWLLEEVAPREYDAERLTEAARVRLRALKIEPPTPGRLERAARSSLRRYDERFREQTLSRLSPRAIAELDALLSGPDALHSASVEPDVPDEARSRESEEATLSRLRADPGRASLESAFAETAKLARLRSVGLPEDLFEGVQCWRNRVVWSGSPVAMLAGHSSGPRAHFPCRTSWNPLGAKFPADRACRAHGPLEPLKGQEVRALGRRTRPSQGIQSSVASLRHVTPTRALGLVTATPSLGPFAGREPGSSGRRRGRG